MGDAVTGLLVILVIRGLFAWGGYALAKHKGRGRTLWPILCFFFGWIPLVILAVAPQRPSAEIIPPAPPYDAGKWAALVASDTEIAAGVHQLGAFGERYVTELATIFLSGQDKRRPQLVIADLAAKAKADAAIAADGHELDRLGSGVETLFRTPRGVVAVLKDGRAFAEVGGQLNSFPGIVDYRRAYDDRATWAEITDAAEKRRFFIAARAVLAPSAPPAPMPSPGLAPSA